MTNEKRWSEAELRAAVRTWKASLEADGRTDLTVRTYVRDANAFVDYLARPRRGGASRAATAPVQRGRRPLVTRTLIPVPAELRTLHRRWKATGGEAQGAMRWPRERYAARLPGHRAVLDAIPDCLDRARLRTIGARAHTSEDRAVLALAAVVVWGKGNTGYGPFHLAAMLTDRPDAGARIHAAVRTLHANGPIAAYRRLGADCSLERLGTSFATKVLAFCQPQGQTPVALIHDDLVREWLTEQGRSDLAGSHFSASIYEAYLAQMAAWASTLGTTPDVVEYLVFAEMSRRKGNEWSALPPCKGR